MCIGVSCNTLEFAIKCEIPCHSAMINQGWLVCLLEQDFADQSQLIEHFVSPIEL